MQQLDLEAIRADLSSHPEAGEALSEAEEQAWPLAFLNSDAASYISGENLYTDGGACSGVLNGSIDATTMVPDIEIQIVFIGNFNDAQKAYDLTRTAFEYGANVVYNVAGPAGLGILKAAADSDKYAIGVDSNQNGIHPDNVIASMLKQIGNSIYNSIEQIKAGEAAFGTVQIFGLEDEGVALIYNDALVTEQVKAQIKAAEARVSSGEIEVDSAF